MRITKSQLKDIAENIAEQMYDLISDNYPDVAGQTIQDMDFEELNEDYDLQDEIENLAMMILCKKIGGKNVIIKKK